MSPIFIGNHYLTLLVTSLNRSSKLEEKDALDPYIIVLTYLGLGGLPFAVSLISIVNSIDPLYIVFEDLLSDAYNREMWVILMSLLSRFLLCSWFLWDFGRFVLFTALYFAVMAEKALSTVKVIGWVPGFRSYDIAIDCRVIFASISDILKTMICFIIFVLHFATVFLLWLPIQCWNFIPLLVAIIAINAGILCVSYAGIIFSVAGNIREKSKTLIRNKMNLHYSTRQNRVDRRYYYYLLWRSQTPIGVSCGSFFIIKGSFAISYLGELMINLVNAVLLLEPHKM